jgi:hypothetical protein
MSDERERMGSKQSSHLRPKTAENDVRRSTKCHPHLLMEQQLEQQLRNNSRLRVLRVLVLLLPQESSAGGRASTDTPTTITSLGNEFILLDRTLKITRRLDGRAIQHESFGFGTGVHLLRVPFFWDCTTLPVAAQPVHFIPPRRPLHLLFASRPQQWFLPATTRFSPCRQQRSNQINWGQQRSQACMIHCLPWRR